MSSSTGPGQLFDYRERVVGRRADDDPVIRLEIYGLLILAFAFSLLMALLTFHPEDVSAIGGTRYQPAENLIGPIGAHVADIFLGALGLGAFVVSPLLGALGFSYLVGRRWHLASRDILGALGVLFCATVLLHVGFAPLRFFGHMPGGLAGEYVGEISRALISTLGTLVLALTGMTVSIVSLTRRSVFELGVLSVDFAKSARARFQRSAGRLTSRVGVGVVEALHEVDPDDIISETEAPESGALQRVSNGPPPLPFEALPPELIPTVEDLAQDGGAETLGDDGGIKIRAPRSKPANMSWAERELVERTQGSVPAEPLAAEPASPAPENAAEPLAEPSAAPSDRPERRSKESEAKSSDEDSESLRIVESAAMRRGPGVIGEQMVLVDPDKTAEFELPSLGFLDYKAPIGLTYDREVLRQNAELLETALADFRVKGKVVEIHPGPVITMYEFKPATGVKISQIANLADDLKMALSALAIRIVAPIPGKDVVGIEVPNKTRETVGSRRS